MKFNIWTMLAGWSMPEHTGISDDLDVLLKALKPAPGLRFITLSSYGAGEAALALAAGGADTVLAYDIEDVHMLQRLISLKVSAAGVLDNHEYLVLMGLRSGTVEQRRAVVSRTLESLSGAEYSFWVKRHRWFLQGLFFANQQTFFMQMFWLLICLLTPLQARRLMLYSECEDTRLKLFRRYVSRPFLKVLFNRLGSRINFFYPKAEWRFSDYPKDFNRDPFPYFERLMGRGLPGNPLFAHYFLDDEKSLPEPLLPPHLRPHVYSGLRAAGERVQVVPSAPGSLPPLDFPPGSYHGAYLSNIIDYLGPKDRMELFQRISRVLTAGAPVLVYSNESYDKVPPECGLEPDRSAGSSLAAQDRVRIYSRVGLFRAAA